MTTLAGEPVFFGPQERPLFGWLHHGSANARVGVVICNPFGYEEICAHRSLRHAAEAAAGAGIPAFRFDYDGVGNSAGDDRDPNRLDAWIASARHAVLALKQLACVDGVVLLGLRLGALIAALAATDDPNVVGLIALAPVVSGKGYLRELRALQRALGLGEPPSGHATIEGGQEALGFAITADTRRSLEAIDLSKEKCVAAPAVLILDRDDLPSAAAWVNQLTKLGVNVHARSMVGYAEMVADPHKAVVPVKTFNDVVAWLSELDASMDHSQLIQANSTHAVNGRRLRIVHSQAKPAAQGIPVHTEAHPLESVVEHAVFMDEARTQFGILSLPVHRPRNGRGILLLNAGSVHHVGPNRLYATLARRWAANGYGVLRMDLSGIGDSRPRPGEADNIVYGPQAVADIGAAIRFLRTQWDCTDVRAIGLCSGAYHAFKAAVAGHPVNGVVLLNPLTFFWKPGQSLDYPAYQVASDAARYSRSVASIEKWMKLVRGQVRLGTVAQTMARAMSEGFVNRMRDLSRRAGLPWKDDLGAELESLARREVDLHFIFAEGDPGLALLKMQGGSAVTALRDRGRLKIDIIDGPDHTFTALWSHTALMNALESVLATSAPRS